LLPNRRCEGKPFDCDCAAPDLLFCVSVCRSNERPFEPFGSVKKLPKWNDCGSRQRQWASESFLLSTGEWLNLFLFGLQLWLPPVRKVFIELSESKWSNCPFSLPTARVKWLTPVWAHPFVARITQDTSKPFQRGPDCHCVTAEIPAVFYSFFLRTSVYPSCVFVDGVRLRLFMLAVSFGRLVEAICSALEGGMVEGRWKAEELLIYRVSDISLFVQRIRIAPKSDRLGVSHVSLICSAKLSHTVALVLGSLELWRSPNRVSAAKWPLPVQLHPYSR